MQKPSPENAATGDRSACPTSVCYENSKIVNHLLLLLHADECRRQLKTGKQIQCISRQCQVFRDVLTHMSTCILGKDCQTPHCAASKIIINHYRCCRNTDCRVCGPLKNKIQHVNGSTNGASSSRQSNLPMVNGVSNETKEQLASNSQLPSNNRGNDWRSLLPDRKREMAMRVFVASVFHTDNSKAYGDPRINRLTEHVKKVELEIYKTAKSADEYVREMAKRCEHMQNELNKKCKKVESSGGTSNEDIKQNTESARDQLVQKFEKSVDINMCKFKTAEDNFPKVNGTVDEKPTGIKMEPIVKSEPEDPGKPNDTENETPELQPVKIEPSVESSTLPSPSKGNKPNFSEEKSFDRKPMDKSNFKKWSQNDLQEHFILILDKLCREKDAEPFLKPVDWEKLDIPNYPRVVTNPMDLSTIRNKILDEKYSNPWDIVEDFWLMFNNAWLFNKKNSKVYRNCSKLAEVFESLIDPVMQHLGFCCGREYQFLPQLLNCCTVSMCRINRDAVYYQYKNEDKQKTNLLLDKYQVCERCHNDAQDFVGITDDTSVVNIPKNEFEKLKNNIKEMEWFINCRECGRKWHKICACHMDEIWTHGFVCPGCTKQLSYKRRENMYTARKLRSCKLSTFLENRVNSYLKRNCKDTGEVIIRVLASADKHVEVKPGMRSRYCETGEMCESWPYRVKAIFAFQVIDGQEVCFFGLHVQEYGSDSPPPNTRRVYVAYLDSVYFFQPKQYRTDIYHEILVGYMDYAKKLGYVMAHIWACPPSEGDDYIFHMHPPDQKIPKPKRLQEWYQKMLQKALNEKIVYTYKDILSDASDVGMMSPTELPYFEGDYWPNQLEELFKEIDDEESKRKKEIVVNKEDEDNEDDNDCDSNSNGADQPSSGINCGSNNSNKKQKAKKRKLKKSGSTGPAGKRKRMAGSGASDMANEICKKVYECMDKHKDNFFVIRLVTQSQELNLAPIKDPDPLIPSELMECRDNFLNSARDKHLEFSSLRRAKYSTLHMLYDIHTDCRQPMAYQCNLCSCQLDTRWHCNICLEYDLCMRCYEKEKHPHPMYKCGADEDDRAVDDKSDTSAQETQREKLERAVKALEHSWSCRDFNCRTSQCAMLRKMINHRQHHKAAENKKCSACQKVNILCFYHAKVCHDAKCTIFYCNFLKNKMRQEQMQQRRQQAKLLRRRMEAMQRSTPSQKSNGKGSSNFQQPQSGVNVNSNLGESPASNSAHTPGGGSQLQTSQPTTPYGGSATNPIQSPQLPQKMPHNSPSQAAPSPYHYNQTLSPYQQIQSSQNVTAGVPINQQCPSSSGSYVQQQQQQQQTQQHSNMYHNPSQSTHLVKSSVGGHVTHAIPNQSMNMNYVAGRLPHPATKSTSQGPFTGGNLVNQGPASNYRQQMPRYQQNNINYQQQQQGMQTNVDQNIPQNMNMHRSMSVPNAPGNNMSPINQVGQIHPDRSFPQIPNQNQHLMRPSQQQAQQSNMTNWPNQSAVASQGAIINHDQMIHSSSVQSFPSSQPPGQVNMMFSANTPMTMSNTAPGGQQVKQISGPPQQTMQSTISNEDIRIVQQNYAHFRSRNPQGNEFNQWLNNNPHYLHAWQFLQQQQQHRNPQINTQFHAVSSNGPPILQNGLSPNMNPANSNPMTMTSSNANSLNPGWGQPQDRLRGAQQQQQLISQQQSGQPNKIAPQPPNCMVNCQSLPSGTAMPNRFSQQPQISQNGGRLISGAYPGSGGGPGKSIRMPSEGIPPQNTALSQLLNPNQNQAPQQVFTHQHSAPGQLLNNAASQQQQQQQAAYPMPQQPPGGSY